MIFLHICIFLFSICLYASDKIIFYSRDKKEFSVAQDDPFLKTGLFKVIQNMYNPEKELKNSENDQTDVPDRYHIFGTMEEFKKIKQAYGKDMATWSLEMFSLIGQFIDNFSLNDKDSPQEEFLKEKFQISKAFFDKISLFKGRTLNKKIIQQFKHISWFFDALYMAKVQKNPVKFLNYIKNNSVIVNPLFISSNKLYVWDDLNIDDIKLYDLQYGRKSVLPDFAKNKCRELKAHLRDIFDDYTYLFLERVAHRSKCHVVKFDENNNHEIYSLDYLCQCDEKITYYHVSKDNVRYLMFYDDGKNMLVYIELPTNFSEYQAKEDNPAPSLLCHLAIKDCIFDIVFSEARDVISIQSLYTKKIYDFEVLQQEEIDFGLRLKLKNRNDLGGEFVMHDQGPERICVKYPITQQLSFVYDYFYHPWQKGENYKKLQLSYENIQNEQSFSIDVQNKTNIEFFNTYLENPAFLLFSNGPKSCERIISIEKLRLYLGNCNNNTKIFYFPITIMALLFFSVYEFCKEFRIKLNETN